MAFAGLLVGSVAQAATVNSYSFSQAGWIVLVPSSEITGPGTLTGTFTGTVNPIGRIELGDLTAFTLNFSVPTQDGTTTGPVGALGELSLFSFNVGNGIDLVIVNEGASTTTCVGAASTLFPACNPQFQNPLDTRGVALVYGHRGFRTTEAPIITLVSSVTTPDGGAGGIPEPSTWAMMIAGFGLVGGALRKRERVGVNFA